MSFKDFNDEGPGTFEWDYVIGGNTTGIFPDEVHYVLENDTLTQVTFSHAGGGTMRPKELGFGWNVKNVVLHNGVVSDWLTFELDGKRYKAIVNKKYKSKKGSYVVDIEQF